MAVLASTLTYFSNCKGWIPKFLTCSAKLKPTPPGTSGYNPSKISAFLTSFTFHLDSALACSEPPQTPVRTLMDISGGLLMKDRLHIDYIYIWLTSTPPPPQFQMKSFCSLIKSLCERTGPSGNPQDKSLSVGFEPLVESLYVPFDKKKNPVFWNGKNRNIFSCLNKIAGILTATFY